MRRFLLLFICLLIFAACSGGGGDDPAATVEDYLQAKVASDDDQIRALLCSEMESVLERETRTFESVTGVEIEDMSCSQDGDSNVVRCDGQIVALYGAEETRFPLVSYRVVEEDGQWKWCGEAP
jgi:hypothetical protein